MKSYRRFRDATCTVKFGCDVSGSQVAMCINSLSNAEFTFLKTTAIDDAKGKREGEERGRALVIADNIHQVAYLPVSTPTTKYVRNGVGTKLNTECRVL
jgi:hypothetical protein